MTEAGNVAALQQMYRGLGYAWPTAAHPSMSPVSPLSTLDMYYRQAAAAHSLQRPFPYKILPGGGGGAGTPIPPSPHPSLLHPAALMHPASLSSPFPPLSMTAASAALQEMTSDRSRSPTLSPSRLGRPQEAAASPPPLCLTSKAMSSPSLPPSSPPALPHNRFNVPLSPGRHNYPASQSPELRLKVDEPASPRSSTPPTKAACSPGQEAVAAPFGRHAPSPDSRFQPSSALSLDRRYAATGSPSPGPRYAATGSPPLGSRYTATGSPPPHGPRYAATGSPSSPSQS